MNVVFPEATYLLFIIVPLIILFWLYSVYRQQSLQNFAQKESLHKILSAPSNRAIAVKMTLLCLVWVFATMALMGLRGNPQYKNNANNNSAAVEEKISDITESEEKMQRRRKIHDVIFLVDASASMDVADMRTKQTRLEYAKDVIGDVISRLGGESIALYAFTSEATTIVPLTNDYLYTRLLLKNIKINEGDVAGTDLLEALAKVKARHLMAGMDKTTTLILLTDGGDTRLEPLTGERREKEMAALINILGDAKENNLRVFTIGLGTHEGGEIPGVEFEGEAVRSVLDESLLRRLSLRGNYYFANDYTSMSIANDVVETISHDGKFEEYDVSAGMTAIVERKVKKDDRINPNYKLYYQIPLGLAIITLMLETLIFRVRKKAVL